MNDFNKHILIICEGKSEYAYIQEVNRILREKDINIVLKAHPAQSGHFNKVQKLYKDIQKQNRNKMGCYIWVDNDIYKRNDLNNQQKYSSRKNNIPAFLFSYYNFEDYLVCHLPKEIVINWQNICIGKQHLQTPLHSDTHLKLLKDNIIKFANYEKGDLPFDITIETLKNALNNHRDSDIKFQCDFIELINNILDLEHL